MKNKENNELIYNERFETIEKRYNVSKNVVYLPKKITGKKFEETFSIVIKNEKGGVNYLENMEIEVKEEKTYYTIKFIEFEENYKIYIRTLVNEEDIEKLKKSMFRQVFCLKNPFYL